MPITEQAPKRIIRCRYLRQNDEQCTAEVLDPEADVLLCLKHSARVVEHARATYERFRLEAKL
ncbi:hypothetical protein [Actinomadura sp. WMMA1423]|uniref:hypothetical protein n=1 Tax=Actinomadura sp. WMMA1423 TaxID=2591108 RepID=UPI001146B6BC|nr:hypothetical protein [Actinomadura sp. WMMA1423]